MAKEKAPDWKKVEADYIAGAKPRELAKKYGVSSKRISDEASRRKWRELRDEAARIAREKLPEKLGDAIAEAGAEWVKESLRLAGELRKLLGAQMGKGKKQIIVIGSMEGPVEVEVPFFNNSRDYQAFVKALADVDKLGRTALRLDEKKEGGGDKPNPGREAGDTDAFARSILEELGEAPTGE